jgi:hypothetical protein
MDVRNGFYQLFLVLFIYYIYLNTREMTNFSYTDPDEDPAPQDNDDSGWTSIPSDYTDYIVKGDTEIGGSSLDDCNEIGS